MARQRAAPDKNLPMSQVFRQSDKQKILSGMSQSQRGDELIEIVHFDHAKAVADCYEPYCQRLMDGV